MSIEDFWFKVKQASIRYPNHFKIRKLSDLSEEERKDYLRKKEDFLAGVCKKDIPDMKKNQLTS